MRRTKEARGRTNRLLVGVNSQERATINAMAAATGMSVSAYLRTCGLGYSPRSVFDLNAASDLLRVNGDLGRLGGLFKLWLSDNPNADDGGHNIRRVLDQIEATALELRGVISRI